MLADTQTMTAVRTGLEELAGLLAETAPDVAGAERSDLVRTIREHLLPRLRDPDAPVVAVIVGSTGVGKSTLLNALAKTEVSPAGVRRPTTTTPVVWGHEEHAGRSWTDFLTSVRAEAGDEVIVVTGVDDLTRDLTMVDTPPLDQPPGGVVDPLLSLADLCVFVTSAARYADRAGWRFLDDVKRRGMPVLFVLDRLPEGPERQAVLADFAGRLAERGLLLDPDPGLVFGVAEAGRDGGPEVPSVDVLRKELGELADREFRHGLVDQTTTGTVQSVADRSMVLAERIDTDRRTRRRLIEIVDASYAEHVERLRTELEEGEFTWLVDHDHWPTVTVDLTGIITRRAGVAAQHAASRWGAEPAGAALLEAGGQGLWRHGHDTTVEIQRLLESWGEGLGETAEPFAKRRRLSRRKRRKAADFLWRLVLDGSTPIPRWAQRAFPDGIGPLRTTAREGLVDTIRRALDLDADRFRSMVAPSDDPDRASKIVAVADRLRRILGEPPPGDAGGDEDPADPVSPSPAAVADRDAGDPADHDVPNGKTEDDDTQDDPPGVEGAP